MEKGEKFQRAEIGGFGYLNKNCWLVKILNYAPYRRCQYCELRFRNCLFLHYQIISLILIFFFLSLSFLIEGKSSKLVIISVFTLVIVYGYFLNRSTDKIIRANFAQREANEALEELNEKLQEKIDQATRRIKKDNIRLKKLLKMREEFLDIASHQLHTPTTYILGIADMLLEQKQRKQKIPEEKFGEILENIYSRAKKLDNIVDDLLNAQEMDTEEFKLTLKPIQLEAPLQKELETVRPRAEDKEIELKYIAPEKPLPKVLSDERYIGEAFRNLIDNAVCYTPRNGRVVVKLEEKNDQILFSVKDTGIGIPKKDQKKIFQKFSRASNATDQHTDGTGLGLFVVKRIVDCHKNAKVWFESKEGQGTTFYISFPTPPTT